MKRTIKRALALIMLFCLAALSGCQKKEGGASTSKLKEGELFRLEGRACTKQEALVFVLSQKSRYEDGYGAGIWDVKVGDETFDSYMKKNLLDFLVKMKCMTLMADQYDVELSDEEKLRVSHAAETYINGLSDSVKKTTGIDKETAEEAFRDYYTASLLVDKLTANVSTEISEDEARVITVQQIFLSTENVDAATKEKKRTDAQEILNQAQAGQDFSLLAKNVNESEVFERELSRGDVEQALETAAFALGNGEMAPLVETEKGFYLIRCVNHYDEIKTAQNKEALGKKHKEDCFYEYYDAFVRGVTAEYNPNAWDAIDYRESYEQQEQDFYTVYSQFFPA
ncbi:MAG: hypothetical protein HFI68_04800 [Lachnospiraceae bacterium]|nr:hypothetical protein [Lachnospiraceae bacterium]